MSLYIENYKGWSIYRTGGLYSMQFHGEKAGAETKRFRTVVLLRDEIDKLEGDVPRLPRTYIKTVGEEAWMPTLEQVNALEAARSLGAPLTVTGEVMSETEYFNVAMSVAQGQGSTSRTPDTGTVQSGTSVTFTATADVGYQFDHWTYDAGFMHNPDIRSATFTRQVTADAVAQAFFISSGGNGQGGNGGDGGNGGINIVQVVGAVSVLAIIGYGLYRLFKRKRGKRE